MASLSEDTRLEPVADGLRGSVTQSWEALGPNGGFLASLAVRGAGTVAGLPLPLAVHTTFVHRAEVGEVTVRAELLRRSRRSEAVAVDLVQGDRLVTRSLVRTVSGGDGIRHDWRDRAPVDKAPEEFTELRDLLPPGAGLPPIADNLEIRPVVTWASWPPTGPQEPLASSWVRAREPVAADDEFARVALLPVVLDLTTWPAIEFAHMGQPSHFAQTATLDVAFLQPVAVTDWLYCEGQARYADAGNVFCTARVWNADGVSVAECTANMVCV